MLFRSVKRSVSFQGYSLQTCPVKGFLRGGFEPFLWHLIVHRLLNHWKLRSLWNVSLQKVRLFQHQQTSIYWIIFYSVAATWEPFPPCFSSNTFVEQDFVSRHTGWSRDFKKGLLLHREAVSHFFPWVCEPAGLSECIFPSWGKLCIDTR